jgi:hypothetical protein
MQEQERGAVGKFLFRTDLKEIMRTLDHIYYVTLEILEMTIRWHS